MTFNFRRKRSVEYFIMATNGPVFQMLPAIPLHQQFCLYTGFCQLPLVPSHISEHPNILWGIKKVMTFNFGRKRSVEYLIMATNGPVFQMVPAIPLYQKLCL